MDAPSGWRLMVEIFLSYQRHSCLLLTQMQKNCLFFPAPLHVGNESLCHRAFTQTM